MDIFSLNNKIIIVTGASGLLGREHIEAIAAFGGTPVLIDLNQKILDEQVDILNNKYNINSSGFAVNITNEFEVKKNHEEIINKYGKIDGLVNNAANNPNVRLCTDNNITKMINTILPKTVVYKFIKIRGLTNKMAINRINNPNNGRFMFNLLI